VGVEPGEPAQTEAEVAEAKKEAFRLKGKRKVYGEEVDFDLDEETALNELARHRAAQKRQADDGKKVRIAQTVLHLLKTDPARLFQEMGHDPDAWAQERLASVMKRNAMSEEERRIADVEAERDQYKSKLDAHLEELQQKQRAQAVDESREATIQRYESALKEAGLKLTHLNVFHMAEVERIALDDGIDLSPKELAAEARRHLSEITNEHLGSLDGPGLIDALGPERVKAILKAAVSQYAKAPGIPGVETTPGPRTHRAPAEERPTTPGEVDANLRRMRLGL
jgi:hypothetical protein